jgi:hypothetical protein
MSRRVHDGGAVLRAPILVVLLAAVLAGSLLDRAVGHAAQIPPPILQEAPVAAPHDALSSSWFCAGATDADKPGSGLVQASGSVSITNGGSAPAAGSVTLVPSQGQDVTMPVSVPAAGSSMVTETVRGGTPWIGAIVDMNAGDVAVDQVVSGPLGQSASPCASSGSRTWYFTNGYTLVNAGVEISILNPYPAATVVDLSFTTNQGVEDPEDFQGLVVPADGLVSVDLGSQLRRRQYIATSVTARTGKVVAWKTDWTSVPARGAALLGTPAANLPLADPASPIPGLTVTLGAPSTGTTWTWPYGIADSGVAEEYVIYNPSQDTAQVQLSLGLSQGFAEPFNLSVGPDQVIPIVTEQQARIPAGVPHSAILESTNGVPVVAERVVAASAPAPWGGTAELLGARMAADTWLVPYTTGGPASVTFLDLFDPGPVAARVTVAALVRGSAVAVPGMSAVTVGSAKLVSMRLPVSGDLAGRPLVVTSSVPVDVETDSYGADHTGINLALGVPVGSQ